MAIPLYTAHFINSTKTDVGGVLIWFLCATSVAQRVEIRVSVCVAVPDNGSYLGLLKTAQSVRNRIINRTAPVTRIRVNTFSLTPPATALMPPVSADGEDLHNERPPSKATSRIRADATTAANR